MIPIYCISLQRQRKERYEFLENNYFKPMKLDVIEWIATDGMDYINTEEISIKNNVKLSKLGKELNKSLIGTAISHRSVWKDIIATNKEVSIILEDDVILYPNFKKHITNIWNSIKEDNNVNFLLLSYSDNVTINHKLKYYSKDIDKIENFNGLFCYMVKKKGAEELLNYTKKLSYQIDIELCKYPKIYYSTKKKLAYFNKNILTTIHNNRFKLFELLFGIDFFSYKVYKLIDFYIITIQTLIFIILAVILAVSPINIYIVNFVNLLIIIIDYILIGCRVDELNIRIAGLLKNIGSYDSEEIENKLVDHFLFSFIFTLIRKYIIYD